MTNMNATETTPTVPNEDRFLTTDEAAVRIGVNRSTLARWRKAGTGPAHTRVGRFVRYRESLLLRWLDSQTTDPAKTQ